jgi:Mn2+/Fe2+ NRAMP family transporter
MKKLLSKVLVALSAVGPGLFLIGYNIGTGSIVTMARSGARHGMTLFWALLLSCIFTYVLMVAYGKVTIVTGKTALSNIKNTFRRFWIGPVLAFYILVALIIGELLALLGIMGIVMDLLQEGSRLLFGGPGFSTFWITLVLSVGLYAIFWSGEYKVFERLLTIFVIFMGVCFIVVFFMVDPDFSAIVAGAVPSIPDVPGAPRLVAAMAGTTVSAAVFVIRSTVVAEKGWTIDDLAGEKRDAFVSAGMMLFLSTIIMAVSAGTLNVAGLRLENTAELVQLFEPIGGEAAAFILILGISAAGLSTVFPIVLIAPWLISDFTDRSRDIRSPLFRTLGGIGILVAFSAQFIEEPPPSGMIFSQAFQAFILPAVVAPILVLINRDDLMKGRTASTRMNVGLVAALLFSLLTAYLAIADFL